MGRILGSLFTIFIWVMIVGGWVFNILKVVDEAQQDKPVSKMFILRIVGIPVAPLGVVLGYVR